MSEVLMRVTFDAVKLNEGSNGVNYYRFDDNAGRQTAIHRSDIVQEVEIGVPDRYTEIESELSIRKRYAKYYRGIHNYYSEHPEVNPDIDLEKALRDAEEAESRVAELQQTLDTYAKQKSQVVNERYEYAIVVNGNMFRKTSKDEAERSLQETRSKSNSSDAVKMVRRPVGEWEDAWT